jgi:flagellar hook-basal body complex protein FliE
MYESILQIRVDDIHAEMLREAANWRLAKQARDGRHQAGFSGRIRQALALVSRSQSSSASASATSRTPSSISDAVTAP